MLKTRRNLFGVASRCRLRLDGLAKAGSIIQSRCSILPLCRPIERNRLANAAVVVETNGARASKRNLMREGRWVDLCCLGGSPSRTVPFDDLLCVHRLLLLLPVYKNRHSDKQRCVQPSHRIHACSVRCFSFGMLCSLFVIAISVRARAVCCEFVPLAVAATLLAISPLYAVVGMPHAVALALAFWEERARASWCCISGGCYLCSISLQAS